MASAQPDNVVWFVVILVVALDFIGTAHLTWFADQPPIPNCIRHQVSSLAFMWVINYPFIVSVFNNLFPALGSSPKSSDRSSFFSIAPDSAPFVVAWLTTRRVITIAVLKVIGEGFFDRTRLADLRYPVVFPRHDHGDDYITTNWITQ